MIPIAIYGISFISRVQLLTQPIWLVLQFLPLLYLAWKSLQEVHAWTQYSGKHGGPDGSFDFLLFGTAASVLLSLLPQIGEQVDYLRFLPNRGAKNRVGWWAAMLATGWTAGGLGRLRWRVEQKLRSRGARGDGGRRHGFVRPASSTSGDRGAVVPVIGHGRSRTTPRRHRRSARNFCAPTAATLLLFGSPSTALLVLLARRSALSASGAFRRSA